jgi:GT2 family glycosyltransferase
LYAQLISKRVWREVGEFDENLRGQDDIDYSIRMRQAGYINAIELSSVVWHHGGVSANLTLDDNKRAEAKRIFNEKWKGVACV